MRLPSSMKVSDIAKLTGLNTRTFHYYDEIGLFSPMQRDGNGYRYYSLEQLYDLGLILSLKELGIPLKEIKALLASEEVTFQRMLEEKKLEAERKIQSLRDIQDVIDRKLRLFALAEEAEDEVAIVDLSEEYLKLSEPTVGATDHQLIESGYDLLMERGAYFLMNNDYGTMMHHASTDVNQVDYIFLTTAEGDADFVKPAGRYLRYIHKGDEGKLEASYAAIREFVRVHELKVEGYFYEKALVEHAQSNHDAYIMEIQVKV